MQLAVAREMVLGLMFSGQGETGLLIIDLVCPGDPGKFRMDGTIARVIRRFGGWRVPVSHGCGFDQPSINKPAVCCYVGGPG